MCIRTMKCPVSRTCHGALPSSLALLLADRADQFLMHSVLAHAKALVLQCFVMNFFPTVPDLV